MSVVTAENVLNWIDLNIHPDGVECGCEWCLMYWNIIKVEREILNERGE